MRLLEAALDKLQRIHPVVARISTTRTLLGSEMTLCLLPHLNQSGKPWLSPQAPPESHAVEDTYTMDAPFLAPRALATTHDSKQHCPQDPHGPPERDQDLWGNEHHVIKLVCEEWLPVLEKPSHVFSRQPKWWTEPFIRYQMTIPKPLYPRILNAAKNHNRTRILITYELLILGFSQYFE